MLVYTGRENKTNNPFLSLTPLDPDLFHDIKEVHWEPITLEQIESKYNLTITVL